MKSYAAEFKLIDRGFRNTLVLIPGWATDYRIFGNLDLGYNYLLPVRFSPFDFAGVLRAELRKRGIAKISLFGYSLGGFLAAGFCAQNAEMIDELILVSIRKRYDLPALEQVKERLSKNKRAFLREFYAACFSPADKKESLWFRERLLGDYIKTADTDYLFEGLNYLANAEINPVFLEGVEKIRIFHGTDDKIAPLGEPEEIKSKLPQAEFVSLEGAGHLVFLSPYFRQRFLNG